MLIRNREEHILQILKNNENIRVAELSSTLGVSRATIRRDLEKLHSLGKLERVHGGAVFVERATPELPVLQRASVHAEEKRRIGLAAAEMVQEGDTIFIGSSTTTLELARNLVDRKDITVISNALTIINTLAQAKGISIISIGGFLRPAELTFIGHLAEQALRELRPQKVFVGIRALSLAAGLTNEYLPEISTDRMIIQSGPEVILLADHSKFDKISTAFVAPLTAVHKIITDSGVPFERIQEIRALGIEVLQV